jgi:D-amino-acid dehydrogenase
VKVEAGHRIRETGWLKAWRGDAVAAAKQEQALLAEYGIASELLDRQAISALEPDIVPVYKVGLLHTETASVDSPGAVVKAYARMCAGAGGDVRQADVKAIVPDGDSWRVTLADGEILARHVVVALGPWSAEILRPIGYRVPLAFERGYHREFKPNPASAAASGSMTSRCHHGDGEGIRVTRASTAGRDAPSWLPSSIRSFRSRAAWPNSATLSATHGRLAPALPDSLPMIGAAPRHAGLACLATSTSASRRDPHRRRRYRHDRRRAAAVRRPPLRRAAIS